MEELQTFQFMVSEIFDEVIAKDESLVFKNEKMIISFYHEQDCCEDVFIESVVGDLSDLIGSPILLAESTSTEECENKNDGFYDISGWTFYKFATLKGYVDVRWFGSSNGYYSIGVNVRVEYLNIS